MKLSTHAQNKQQKKIIHLVSSCIFLFVLFLPTIAFWENLPLWTDASFWLPFSNVSSNEWTATGIAKIIKQAVLFTGVFAVMALTYGGILMMLSYWDDWKVKWAKNIIQYALIGVVLAAAAYVIVDTLYSITL
jgi:Type IV secretion system pilin